MAVVTTVAIGLENMSDLGVRQSIVRSENGDKLSFRKTAWIFQIGRGILLTILCALITTALYLGQSYSLLPVDKVYGNENLPIAMAIS